MLQQNQLSNLIDLLQVQTKQKESDSIFEHFISKFNITDEHLKDDIFDYCYNDFETPYLKNYIKELNDSARV